MLRVVTDGTFFKHCVTCKAHIFVNFIVLKIGFVLMCQRYMYLFIFVYFLKYIWFVLNQGQFRCWFLHGNFFCPVCNGKITRVSKLVRKGSMSMLVAYKAEY